MSSNTLAKKERLKSFKLINELFAKGAQLFSHPIKLYYLQIEAPDIEAKVLFSVSVPKRLFKKASDRNLIKRRIREAYRLNKPEFVYHSIFDGQKFAFMYVYIHREKPDFLEIHEAMLKLNRKFKQYLDYNR